MIVQRGDLWLASLAGPHPAPLDAAGSGDDPAGAGSASGATSGAEPTAGGTLVAPGGGPAPGGGSGRASKASALAIRPVVVTSNNRANRAAAERGRGVVTVVPVSSNTERIFPFHVLLPADVAGFSRDAKAQAEQIRSIDVGRLKRKVGRLDASLMEALDDAIRLQLDLR